MSKDYYQVVKTTEDGHHKWHIVTPAGVIQARVLGEIMAYRICDLLNWHMEALRGMETCKWHTAKDVRARMLEMATSLPKKSPPPLAAPLPLPGVASKPAALPLPGTASVKLSPLALPLPLPAKPG